MSHQSGDLAEQDADLLWEAVVDGTIDAIVSDHSPSTPDLKRSGDGDFGLMWGGIAGLQVGLSAVWTEARRRGIPLAQILPLFTTGPARVAGAHERQRVLERFYRIDGVSGEGSGLGMSIVQRIVGLHGATWRLGEGKGGKGLRVEVAFPALET